MGVSQPLSVINTVLVAHALILGLSDSYPFDVLD